MIQANMGLSPTEAETKHRIFGNNYSLSGSGSLANSGVKSIDGNGYANINEVPNDLGAQQSPRIDTHYELNSPKVEDKNKFKERPKSKSVTVSTPLKIEEKEPKDAEDPIDAHESKKLRKEIKKHHRFNTINWLGILTSAIVFICGIIMIVLGGVLFNGSNCANTATYTNNEDTYTFEYNCEGASNAKNATLVACGLAAIVVALLVFGGHMFGWVAFRRNDPRKMRIAYKFYLTMVYVSILHCNPIWFIIYWNLSGEAVRLAELYVHQIR